MSVRNLPGDFYKPFQTLEHPAIARNGLCTVWFSGSLVPGLAVSSENPINDGTKYGVPVRGSGLCPGELNPTSCSKFKRDHNCKHRPKSYG